MKDKFIPFEGSDASVFFQAMHLSKDPNLVRNFIVSMRERDKHNAKLQEMEQE